MRGVHFDRRNRQIRTLAAVLVLLLAGNAYALLVIR